MKKIFLPLLLLTYCFANAQTIYVSGTGNDAADGKTMKTAFRTLQKAANVVQAGNTVIIGDGTYTNDGATMTDAVLKIDASGTADKWITWKAAPGAHPEIHPGGWAGILISGSYHIIDGITVTGANDSLVLLEAQMDTKNEKANAKFNTNGIFVNGRLKGPAEKPHHVIIRACTVRKCPGGGIVFIEADYTTAEDCTVYENAWFMRYGGSGITTLNNWAFDDAPGYHTVIQRNRVWNNKTQVAWEKIGRLSDGNGIILDVTDGYVEGATNPNADKVVKKDSIPAAPQKPKPPVWKSRALIANNLSAFNGGSGIHTFRTSHVDIINNTTYHNGGIVGYPEIFANTSQDVVFLNNIIVPRPGGKVTSNNKNTNIRWDYNLYPKPQTAFQAANDVVDDPKFIAANAEVSKANFHLQKGSAALNSGCDEVPQKTDIDGKLRPLKSRDRGAYEQ